MPEHHSDLPEELRPSRYIEKVSLVTGEVLEDEILPRQLLVSTHRDYHIVDVQARRFMSRLMDSTGDEEKVRRKMREVRQQQKAKAKISREMAGTDTKMMENEFLDYARANVANDEFDALIGLADEAEQQTAATPDNPESVKLPEG